MVPCVAFVIQLHTILGELHFINPQNALPPTPPGLKIVDVLYPETLSGPKKFFVQFELAFCCTGQRERLRAFFFCLGNIGNSCELLSWGKYDSTQECIGSALFFNNIKSKQFGSIYQQKGTKPPFQKANAVRINLT